MSCLEPRRQPLRRRRAALRWCRANLDRGWQDAAWLAPLRKFGNIAQLLETSTNFGSESCYIECVLLPLQANQFPAHGMLATPRSARQLLYLF